jgi:phage replisome organizer, putative, N-terminal region
MSEVKWIKITTDMFENRKIRHLRKLPDGNNIVLIWVMLLSLAGKCNAGGMIFLTENIPYTPKMLADELDFEENTVILALDALESLGMIRRDGFLVIEDWAAHQNAEGLDKIREQNRNRVANYRQRQKALQENNGVTLCNVTERYDVTQCNAPRIRIDIDKEEDIEEDTPLKGGLGGNEKDEKKPSKKTDYGKEEFEKDLSVLSKPMADSVVEWLKYKKQRREAYKPVSIKKFITQVKGYAEQYGDEAVMTVISDSIANGYMGVAFASIKGKKPNGGSGSRTANYDYSDTEGAL